MRATIHRAPWRLLAATRYNPMVLRRVLRPRALAFGYAFRCARCGGNTHGNHDDADVNHGDDEVDAERECSQHDGGVGAVVRMVVRVVVVVGGAIE